MGNNSTITSDSPIKPDSSIKRNYSRWGTGVQNAIQAKENWNNEKNSNSLMTTNNSKISTLNNPNKKRRQISIPFSGMLKFNLDPHTINLIKLQINKKGFFLKKGLEIHLENTEFRYSFRIPFGFILIIIPNQ